jgi:hypothetical protein
MWHLFHFSHVSILEAVPRETELGLFSVLEDSRLETYFWNTL